MSAMLEVISGSVETGSSKECMRLPDSGVECRMFRRGGKRRTGALACQSGVIGSKPAAGDDCHTGERQPGAAVLQFALAVCLLLWSGGAMAGMAIGVPKAAKNVKRTPAVSVTQWGLPLVGGAVRALAIAPRFTLLDVTELAQRLELRCETVPFWDATHPGCDPASAGKYPCGPTTPQTLDRLRELLRGELDVVLLGNIDASTLPDDIVSDLMSRVSKGVGLVIANLRDQPGSPLRTLLDVLEPLKTDTPLTRGIGETGLPGWGEGAAPIRVLAHGEGRVIIFEYPGDLPANHFLMQAPLDPLDIDPVFTDNAWALVARAVCIAAKRDAPGRIAAIEDSGPKGPTDDEIPPGFPEEYVKAMKDPMAAAPVRPFALRLEAPATERYRIAVQTRHPGSDTRMVHNDESPLSKGEGAHPFDMIIGPGVHFLDAWLYRGDKVVDWYTQQLTIPGWPEFSNVVYEKTWVQPNDTLRVSLKVRPVINRERQCAVYARATDTYGRLVSEAVQAVSSDGGDVSLQMHLADLITPLIKVEVYAIEGEGKHFSNWDLERSPRAFRYISVRSPRPDANMSLTAIVPPPREPNQEALLRILARTGVDTVQAAGGEAGLVRTNLQGLRFLPETVRIAADRAVDGNVRRPCLDDKEYRQRTKKAVEESVTLHWAGGSGRYSIGNGNLLCATEENVCQCPASLDAFHTWLRKEYDGIESLNQSWGTSYTDWSQAVPESVDAARSSGRFAAWVDFRMFEDEGFAEFHGMLRQAVRGVDHAGETGFRAFDDANPVHGYWWPALASQTDFIAADWEPVTAEKLRCYHGKGAWSGLVVNDIRDLGDARRAAWFAWGAALMRLPAVCIAEAFGDAGDAAPGAALQPDGSPTPPFAALAASMNELKQGAGPLLLGAMPEPAPIVLYDSHPSRYLADADPDFALSVRAAQQAWMEALDAGNRSWDIIDETRLDRLADPGCRVLVLPLCRALSEGEVAAVQAFAARGGLVVADILPGTHDGHGAVRGDIALAALFGVHASAKPQVKEGLPAWTAPDPPASQGFAGMVACDGALNLESGLSLGGIDGAPLWVRNTAEGKNTLLLNHVPRLRAASGDRKLLPLEYAVLERALNDAGCASMIPGGGRFDGRLRAYRYDRARLVAMLADPAAGETQKVSLPFGENDRVFNLRTGQTVGKPQKATIKLDPGAAALFSALDHKVDTVQVVATPTVNAGRRVTVKISIRTDGPLPGRRLVAVDMAPEDGQSPAWARRFVICENGAGETYFPIALNDATGKYRVRARDLLSGGEGSIKVLVLPVAER